MLGLHGSLYSVPRQNAKGIHAKPLRTHIVNHIANVWVLNQSLCCYCGYVEEDDEYRYYNYDRDNYCYYYDDEYCYDCNYEYSYYNSYYYCRACLFGASCVVTAELSSHGMGYEVILTEIQRCIDMELTSTKPPT